MIYHAPHGSRTVVRDFHDRHLVAVGRHHGYLERRYSRDRFGREYRLRTYYWGQRHYAVVYRTYYWGGRPYYWYVPAYYYRPAYYAWAYNPWPGPVIYHWGWLSDPWYPYYGYYFVPYAEYTSANLWLTDFILAENLRMAFEAQRDASVATTPAPVERLTTSDTTQLSPEVKQLIAEEVKEQLAAERQAAVQTRTGAPEQTNQTPPALDPAHRVFILASSMDVTSDDGEKCGLTPGDIILRTGDTLVDGNKVAVSVQSSKRGNCRPGTNARLQIAELQEMHNHFREQIDAGLKELATNSGKHGLPRAPDTATSAAVDIPAPVPDKDVLSQVDGLQSEADKAESEIEQPVVSDEHTRGN